MNIFFTSYCPRECAQALDDARVVKMCLETAQLLSTAGYEYSGLFTMQEWRVLYRATHRAHPCTKWAGADIQNYLWLAHHGEELCKEYTRRFLKVHDSAAVIAICKAAASEYTGISRNPFFSPFQLRISKLPNCARNSSLEIDCTQFSPQLTECYREYLRRRWELEESYAAVRKSRRAPKWTAPAMPPKWKYPSIETSTYSNGEISHD